MNWFDRKIDDFIRNVRNKNPIGVDPKNPIAIGKENDPTYWRWYVWPRNYILNCYLHNFRHDDEQDLHDHRMMNISFILQGDYYEERFIRRPTAGLPLPTTKKIHVRGRRPKFRLPATPHRVVLPRDGDGKPIHCWSLFIGFPQIRQWGFWCPGNYSAKWLSQEDYLRTRSGSKYAYSDEDPIMGCGG